MLQNLKSRIKAEYYLILEKLNELKIILDRNEKLTEIRNWIKGYLPALEKYWFQIIVGLFVLISFWSSMCIFVWRSPRPFPEHVLVSVERGQSLKQIANSFEENGVVRSKIWLRIFVTLLGGEKSIVAGDYYLPEPVGVWGVAKILHKGEFGLIAQKITILEGSSSFEIADMLEKYLPSFIKTDFLDEVKNSELEGYLFPDTYFFMPNSKASDIILIMRENFARQIKPYEEDILKSEKSIKELVTMASILEGEARTLESKRIIADILWRRIRKKMPLQVDAPFKYHNGKNSYTLTKEDLKEDHEYNTYVNKDLPPTPISNPGIDSIRAAIAPTPNQYWYFMSDKQGHMYYAVDFEGHKRNRELYLN